MDPLTIASILTLIELAERITLAVIEKQPPDVAAELWRIHLEDVKEARKFWKELAQFFEGKKQDPT